MEIAVINDIHLGVRNDARFMLDYGERFFSQIFFPVIDKRKISTILIGGDVYDRRKYINFYTASRSNKFFFDEAKKRGIEIHIIPGNHDVYFKSTNDISSLNLLLPYYDNIKLYDDPVTLEFDGVTIDMIPWINNENYGQIMNFMKDSKSEFCYGHFDIIGFEMYRGLVCDHGLDRSVFKKYKQVWSGHFHCKSKQGNIIYTGAPLEFTFADCGDWRGFHIFDTKKKKLEPIQNTITLFEKIYYDDSTTELQEKWKSFDVNTVENKIVRVYASKKQFPALFENLVDSIMESNIIQLTVQEDYSSFASENVDTEIESTTTKELIEQYVDNVETDMDKPKIKSILNNLYMEALQSQLTDGAE